MPQTQRSVSKEFSAFPSDLVQLLTISLYVFQRGSIDNDLANQRRIRSMFRRSEQQTRVGPDQDVE